MPPRIVVSVGPYGCLTHALECARLLAPLHHISIVTPPHVDAIVHAHLAGYHGIEVLVPPREQRSPDPLLALTHVFARDPLSSIVFLPSEFCIVEPQTLARAIRAELAEPDPISLLGLEPFEWGTPGNWNPVIAIGRTTSFWDLVRMQLSRHAALYESYLESIGTASEAAALSSVYESSTEVDFTGDLLVKAPLVHISSLPISTLRSHAARQRPSVRFFAM